MEYGKHRPVNCRETCEVSLAVFLAPASLMGATYNKNDLRLSIKSRQRSGL